MTGRKRRNRFLLSASTPSSPLPSSLSNAAVADDVDVDNGATKGEQGQGGSDKKMEGENLIHISEDPLDLSNEMPSDYRNWAAVLSQVLLKKEELLLQLPPPLPPVPSPSSSSSSSPSHSSAGAAVAAAGNRNNDTKNSNVGERALAALDALTLATRMRLSRAASGDAELFPRFQLTDPIFHAEDDGGTTGTDPSTGTDTATDMTGHGGHSMGEGKSMITGIHTSSSFINYAPCVLGEHLGGAMAEATGLRFAPSLVSVMLAAFEGRAQGVNLEPRLIYIQPMGANAQVSSFSWHGRNGSRRAGRWQKRPRGT